jgi:predicted Zn-dependent protease with MMP-like domain
MIGRIMTVAQAREHVAALLAELPQEVHDALENVIIHVVENAPSEVPDAKAVFDGEPLAGGQDDEDDDGPYYDLDEDGSPVRALDIGTLQPAKGQIVLFASNLRSPDEVQAAILHEMSHALGEDEDDVFLLGVA